MSAFASQTDTIKTPAARRGSRLPTQFLSTKFFATQLLSKTLLSATLVSAMSFSAPTVMAAKPDVAVDEGANISQSTAGFRGLSQISLSVRDLDSALAFYEEATGFAVIDRQDVSGSAVSDELYGRSDIAFRSATLRAPNLLFELIEFPENRDVPVEQMPPQGPGMTHTCFQSPIENPGFDRFDAAGAETISYGGKPVDLGGYGVTYAYAYDPEGNMIELEQLDAKMLARSGYVNTETIGDHPLWMSQVALATHDIERLMGFYKDLLGFMPYRVAELKDNAKADAIAGIDNLHILGGWFRLNDSPKVLEIWEYKNPMTLEPSEARTPRSLGYSYVLEVDDAAEQHERMTTMGVETFSEPVAHGDGMRFYARDIDGNVFAIHQPNDPGGEHAVSALDAR